MPPRTPQFGGGHTGVAITSGRAAGAFEPGKRMNERGYGRVGGLEGQSGRELRLPGRNVSARDEVLRTATWHPLLNVLPGVRLGLETHINETSSGEHVFIRTGFGGACHSASEGLGGAEGLGELSGLDDIADRNTTTGFEGTETLGDNTCLIRGQVDDTVGDYHVKLPVRGREVLDLPEPEGGVRHSLLLRTLPRPPQHIRRHVHPNRRTRRADLRRRQQHVDPGAAPKVEHMLSNLQVGEDNRRAATHAEVTVSHHFKLLLGVAHVEAHVRHAASLTLPASCLPVAFSNGGKVLLSREPHIACLTGSNLDTTHTARIIMLLRRAASTRCCRSFGLRRAASTRRCCLYLGLLDQRHPS
eukprot:Hpha_TRINITY_DN9542_c0_g1::TRINITY_DN9542_c0_g1_i1::g.114788::m.114788